MATSEGRDLGGSIYKGSVKDFQTTCEPCKDEGTFVEASGYCENCNEYLCLACTKTHCRPKPCRHHVVLDKLHMPQSQPRDKHVSICNITCDTHPTKCLKFFCKIHDVTGCGVCMIREHKTCDFDSISTIADGYNTSQEYISIIQRIEELISELNSLLKNSKGTATKAETTIQKAVNDIKHYRNEVVAYFDKAERILAAECDEIQTVNHTESEKINAQLKSSSNKLTATHDRLTMNVQNTANLFVQAKESRSVLTRIEHEIEDIKKLQLTSVEFTQNTTFESHYMCKLLTSVKATECLGNLQVSALPITFDMRDAIPEHKADISIVACSDSKHWYMTGMVHVRENTIACTDNFNNSVKLVDIEHGELLFTMSLLDSPWAIASIAQDRVAVTHPHKHTIQFLGIKDGVLLKSKLIDVNGECRGIDCSGDKLVVSFIKPGKVEILDLNGICMKLIQTNSFGNNIFKCPCYVAVSRDGSSFFVSDNKNNSVVKCSLTSKTLRKFISAHLEQPQGMFVCQDGSLLVCTLSSVVVVSPDFQGHKEVIAEENGMSRPTVICCDEDDTILCLRKEGDLSSDIIQTFKLIKSEK